MNNIKQIPEKVIRAIAFLSLIISFGGSAIIETKAQVAAVRLAGTKNSVKLGEKKTENFQKTPDAFQLSALSALESKFTLNYRNPLNFMSGIGGVKAQSSTINVALPSNSTASNGTVISIPISVGDTSGGGIFSYDFSVSFDPNVLQPSSPAFDTNNTISGAANFSITPNASSGLITVSGFGTQALNGAGKLIYLRFDVIGTSGTVTGASNLTFQSFTFNEGNPPANTTGGTFTVVPQAPGFEADISPRPNGNSSIDADDIQQIRRFSVGLDMPYQSNEFQRADTSPRTTSGDGVVDADDIQQARRYSVGLDAKLPSGGQSQSNGVLFEDWKQTVKFGVSEAGATRVRIKNTNVAAGARLSFPVSVDAIGDEAGFSFSLSYDDAKISNPSVTIGTAGGDVLTNITASNPNANPIGFSVTSFPGGTLAAGANQLLLTIEFKVAANALPGAIDLIFGDAPTGKKVSGTDPNILLEQTTFDNGNVTILKRRQKITIAPFK